MAWKGDPTNKNVPNPKQHEINRSEGRLDDNRALHVRRDTDVTKNFTVGIKDVDEVVFSHLQGMDLTVVDNGNHIKVPVSYASPEKWKSVRNDGFMRDNNGRIILPALIFYRTSSESDKNYASFNKYLRYPVIKTYSQKNQYTKFSSMVGQKNKPLSEVYNVVCPDHMKFNYKFILWTEYIEQMNSLIERINFETNDYWGAEKGLRFRTFVDSYTHITEVQTDSDRLIKTEFDLTLHGYLLPERFAPGLDGFKSTTEKTFTAKKVILGTEIVSTGWEPTVDPKIKDRWRSQHYPNITTELEKTLAGQGIKVLGLNDSELKSFRNSFATTIVETGTVWHPAPTSSTDYGEQGWQAYDNDYYYLYTGGSWKRVPLVLFNAFGS